MENNNINKQLEEAVRYGNSLEKVKALLSAGADANQRIGRNNDTLLHVARGGEIFKELLLRGAYVNATNMYSDTPLHCAIKDGKGLVIVRELLKHGANVNATNRKCNTALNHAVKKSYTNLEVVRELLVYGADINIRNREQRLFYEDHNSSLDNAAGNLECAKLLIKFTLIRTFNKDYKKFIDLDPYKKFSTYSDLSSYLDDCVCEAVQMKTDEIKDGLTVYDLFNTNFDLHALCNNPLSVRLSKIDYSVRYPIYNDLISDKIQPFLDRADLLNKISKIQFYTKLVVEGKITVLDHDSTYNVTKYLSNDNLLNFVMAFDDFNNGTIQSSNSSNNLVESDTRLDETSNNTNKRARLE